MTPFTGFLAGVALMLVADGLACLLAPRVLRHEYMRRAGADDDAMRRRGWWLASSGVGLLLLVAFL
jgi:uncharacterized protein YjeT (DUF2065 family)